MRKHRSRTRQRRSQTLHSDWHVGTIAPHAACARQRAPKRPTKRGWLRATHLESTLWLLTGLALVVSLWASPRMQPRVLMITGAPPAAHAAIEARLRTLWREPYGVQLSAGALEAELAQLGWVAQVQIVPRLPARLQVHLQPREPFVAIRDSANRQIFIDPAGIVFSSPNPPHSVPGGIIRLLAGHAIPDEGALQPDSPLERAFKLLQALHDTVPPASRGEPQGGEQPLAFGENHPRWEVELTPNGELNLLCQAEGGLPLRFQLGDAAEWQQQAEVIRLVVSSPMSRQARWEYIDLKSPSHPAVKRLAMRSEQDDGNR
jgi:hypothetical protein